MPTANQDRKAGSHSPGAPLLRSWRGSARKRIQTTLAAIMATTSTSTRRGRNACTRPTATHISRGSTA